MAGILGKSIGLILGWALDGSFGAIVGVLFGHLYDAQRQGFSARRSLKNDYFPDFAMSENQKAIFSVGVIVLGAKLAKADGHVTREKVLAFRQFFRTNNAQLAEVGRLFDKARVSSEGYEPYAARLAGTFGGMPEILEEILAGLFCIAVADKPRLSRAETLFLRRVSVIFGLSEADFQRIAARVGIRRSIGASPAKILGPYDVLGLSAEAGDKEIKRTYRAIIRKNHPDMLVAQGASPQKVAEATERMKKINVAYAEICKSRNIK